MASCKDITRINISRIIEKKEFIPEAFIDSEKNYVTVPFFKHGKPLPTGKKWGITLLKGGSMRFRWNEENENRQKIFDSIIKTQTESGDSSRAVVPLELVHSKDVFKVSQKDAAKNLKGDGIITAEKTLVPSVTVADCVPIYFYDEKTGVFGVVHSGWKGTGIIENALRIAERDFGADPKDICAAIGPHISKECYTVDRERFCYFTENFGNCAEKTKNPATGAEEFHLSLTDANLFLLKKCGILEENTVVADDCTCCQTFSDGTFVFGSFRRQAADAFASAEEKSRLMTVQAAFIV